MSRSHRCGCGVKSHRPIMIYLTKLQSSYWSNLCPMALADEFWHFDWEKPCYSRGMTKAIDWVIGFQTCQLSLIQSEIEAIAPSKIRPQRIRVRKLPQISLWPSVNMLLSLIEMNKVMKKIPYVFLNLISIAPSEIGTGLLAVEWHYLTLNLLPKPLSRP